MAFAFPICAPAHAVLTGLRHPPPCLCPAWMADDDDDVPCSCSTGARSRWQRAHLGRSAPARCAALGGVSQGDCGRSRARWSAVDERRMRPLSSDHGGVLELADAGGSQRPPGPAHHPHSRVPWSGTTHGLTRCARDRPSLRKRPAIPTSNCLAEWSSELAPAITARKRVKALLGSSAVSVSESLA